MAENVINTGDSLSANERIIRAVAKLEVQIDTLISTVGELSRSVKIISDEYADIKATVRQIQSTETHTPLGCQQTFDNRYLKSESIADIHARLHNEMLQNNNLKASAITNYWKVITIILSISFVLGVILSNIN